MRIIAITGMKRAGKDTIAEYLSSAFGYENVKVAGTLKEIIKLMFNMTHSQVEGDQKEHIDARWGITPRQAMQFIGTEMMQFELQRLLPDIGRNFWIKQLCTQLSANNVSNSDTHYAISDVRFVHEVDELRRNFGDNLFVLKVVRPTPSAMQQDEHSSEKEWMQIDADATIVNDTSLFNLYERISTIVNGFHDRSQATI